MIELTARDGHTLSAYRVDPAGAAKGAVVVLHDASELNGQVQKLADAFAAKGYVVIAPSLFDLVNSDANPPPDGAGNSEDQELKRRFEGDRVLADIQAAVDSVQSAGKVAVVGYAKGGYLAYVSGNRVKGLACAIGYYGEGIVEDYQKKRKIPTLLHFGETDPSIPNEKVTQFRARRPDVSAFTYPGAGNGFRSDEGDDCRLEAARVAHDRTLFWISQYVEGQAPIALKNAGIYAQAKVDKKKKLKSAPDDLGPPAD